MKLTFILACIVISYFLPFVISMWPFVDENRMHRKQYMTHPRNEPSDCRNIECKTSKVDNTAMLMNGLKNDRGFTKLDNLNEMFESNIEDEDVLLNDKRTVLSETNMNLNKELEIAAEMIDEQQGLTLYKDEHLIPCSCRTTFMPQDLGKRRFPRHVMNATCEENSCWGGPYKCQEVKYEVQVLTPKAPGELDLSSSLMPHALRQLWRFETIQVVAACQCVP